MTLVLENWHKKAIPLPSGVRKKMTLGHWIELICYVPFSALTLKARFQERHPDHAKSVPLIPRGSFPEWVEVEDP